MSRRLAAAVLVAAAGLLGACAGTASTGGATSPNASAPTATASPAAPLVTSPVAPSGQRPAAPGEQAALDADLRAAAWVNDVPTARGLVERGADVNAKDDTQQSAYLIATSEGYGELLELTLVSGALLDDKDSWNGTGLIRAAERGHRAVVARLLRAGIDRDHVNRIGYQAIHEAVWLGADTAAYVDTVRVLTAGGVTLTRPSVRESLTPLQMAQRRGLDRLRSVLVRVTSEPAPAQPTAALFAAAAQGDADGAALALRAGAALDARDSAGDTASAVATRSGHEEVTRLLVALGAKGQRQGTS